MAQHRTITPRAKLVGALAALLAAALLAGGGIAASGADRTTRPAASADASASVSTPPARSTPTASSSTSSPRTVTVTLTEKNESGVSGRATVTDSTVTATATGLDPEKSYHSFVYGAGSSASGSNPCILTGERAAGPINTVGRWRVDSDGGGTLSGRITLPALKPGTLSIREDDLGARGAVGPTPADSLVACGRIGPRATTPAGQVQDRLPAVKVPAIPTATR